MVVVVVVLVVVVADSQIENELKMQPKSIHSPSAVKKISSN